MAAQSGDLAQVVESYVNDNKVMIFSKSRCPYCRKVKELFKSLDVDYFAVELDQLPNGKELQTAMAQKVGKSSVPQVFINNQHIGGCDDTMAAHSNGQLMKHLQ